MGSLASNSDTTPGIPVLGIESNSAACPASNSEILCAGSGGMSDEGRGDVRVPRAGDCRPLKPNDAGSRAKLLFVGGSGERVLYASITAAAASS